MREADAIVVLGCRVERDGELSHAAARRAKGALELFRAECAPTIVTSGGKRWGPAVEALAFGQQLIAWGVPSGALYPELSSLTTAENAAYSVALVSRLVGRRPRIKVVTCAWHLPRALESFRRFAADVDGLGVEPPRPTRLVSFARTVREAVSSRLDRVAHARGGSAFERYAPHHLGSPEKGSPC